MNPLFHPPVMGARTGRLGKFYRATPDPDRKELHHRCFALLLLIQPTTTTTVRVTASPDTATVIALLRDDIEPLTTNAILTDGGHRGRGRRRTGLGGNIRTLFFSFLIIFSSLCYFIGRQRGRIGLTTGLPPRRIKSGQESSVFGWSR